MPSMLSSVLSHCWLHDERVSHSNNHQTFPSCRPSFQTFPSCRQADLHGTDLTCRELGKLASKQEHTYCKQIVCQLRTQYLEAIYSNSVTLKPTLRVTQGH